MPLAIDDRTVRPQHCDQCGRTFDHVTGFIAADGEAHAVYFAACHGHPEHEAWIDVILGTWGHDDPDKAADHITFSCQLRPEGAAAVDAVVAVEGTAGMFGQKLSRGEALAHPWLPRFWAVIDLVAVEDDTIRSHIGAAHLPE